MANLGSKLWLRLRKREHVGDVYLNYLVGRFFQRTHSGEELESETEVLRMNLQKYLIQMPFPPKRRTQDIAWVLNPIPASLLC